MMNHSLISADRNTHVRIVAVSVACAVVFVAALVGARVTSFHEQMVAGAPVVVKASPLTTWTNQEPASIVR